jgi:hypothetical protein
MQKLWYFFIKCMLWGSIPFVFGFEYWEHFLSVPDGYHIITQVIILGIGFNWIWFWYQRLLEFEIEKVSHFYIEKSKVIDK